MSKETSAKVTSSKSEESPMLNGGANGVESPANPQLDPEVAKKIATMRSHVRESFGKVVMAMMMLPRYRRQSLDDLQHLVLEPLIADRIAIAYPSDAAQNVLADVAGVAIWASVSESVDATIRDQIKAGVFPIRLKAEEWNSGSINWLLDVIAPNPKATTSVIANFRQVVKDGDLRLHPIITRLVDSETLARMAPKKVAEARREEETVN
ncbi:toxin-activating lysine-acyltransferase [Sphingomonas sp.]|uniref:toxin-activating lysine-acyltransferase n=2 Tax=Alphaproteobacteria TaxID=28211 RepID=UPI003561CDD7